MFVTFIFSLQIGHFISTKKTPLTPGKIAKLMADIAYDTKAEDILVLDMRKIVNYCDYFVIASGTSDRHTRAIADNVEQDLYQRGFGFALKQGRDKGEWICYDSGDVVLHVFQKEMREFYGLERLWSEAKSVPLKFDDQ